MATDQDQLARSIDSFLNARDVIEQQESLDRLTADVLPCLPFCEVEVKLFCKILPKVYEIVLGQLSGVSQLTLKKQNDRNVLEQIQQHLQSVKSIMDCLENCILHSRKSVEFPEQLTVQSVQSLLSAVGQTVKATFTHCKDSEGIYGELFGMVSQELSLIFRRTYQLQKSLMEILEHIQLNYDDQQEVYSMAEACHQLLEICIVISDLDMSLLVNTWKVLNRLVMKHGKHMAGQLQVGRLIGQLCSSVEARLIQWVKLALQCSQENLAGDQGDQKVLAKLSKVVRFLLGHLGHLIKEFHSSPGICVADVLHLLLILYSQVAPSPSAPRLSALAVQELNTVLTGVEPVLLVLVRNTEFARLVTRKDQDPDEQHIFAYCRILICLLTPLCSVPGDVFLQWMAPAKEESCMSVLQALFHYIKLCAVDLALLPCAAGAKGEGESVREESSYHDVCTKISALVMSTPADCFHVVEQCLLENLLCDSVVGALLAADVWVAVARWASPDLCASHVTFLIQLLKTLPRPTTAHAHVSQLVRRLVRVLSPQYQLELLATFPPSKPENIVVWSAVLLQALPDTLTKRVCSCLFPLCVKIGQACAADLGSRDNSRQLLDCLSFLRAIYTARGMDTIVGPVHQAAVLRLVSSLWARDVTVACGQARENLVPSLLALSSVLLPFMEAEVFVEITAGMRDLLTRSPTVHTRLAVAEFLGRCGNNDVPQPMEACVLTHISSLFSALVSDAEWIVHQRAFEGVKAFAEVTRHTHVMADCVPGPLLPALSDFLKQVPLRSEQFTDESRRQLLQRQMRDAQVEHLQPDEMQPAAKRMKTDPAHSSQAVEQPDIQGNVYKQVLADLKARASTLMELRKHHVPTTEVSGEVESIRAVLGEFGTGTEYAQYFRK